MKKSLELAMEAARQFSLDHPKEIVKVMDKYRSRAVICVFSWVYRERVLCGYHRVATFINGKEVWQEWND